MTDKRVLVIEDELLVGLDVVFQLEAAGFGPVEHAATEDEALLLLQTREWDVVVADANLNGRDIEQVVRVLHGKRLPFAIVSGYERHSLPTVIGGAPVLSKPIDGAQLIRTITTLCEQA